MALGWTFVGGGQNQPGVNLWPERVQADVSALLVVFFATAVFSNPEPWSVTAQDRKVWKTAIACKDCDFRSKYEYKPSFEAALGKISVFSIIYDGYIRFPHGTYGCVLIHVTFVTCGDHLSDQICGHKRR